MPNNQHRRQPADQHDEDLEDDFEQEELDGEAEASRRRSTQPRRWPYIVLFAALPVAGLVMLSLLTKAPVRQPQAANIQVAPVPPLSTPLPPPSPDGQREQRSTAPPGTVRTAVVTRTAGSLSGTSRAEKAREEAKREKERQEAAAQATRERARGGTQEAANDRARPGVQRQRPWLNAHPEFTIPSHTPIRCSPDSPINSDGLGPVSCTVESPIRSEDGTNILIWPGAVIEGTIGQGLQMGQRRLMVAFDRIRTTDYVRIPLRGIGASALGENGITGTYDSHLWERIQAGVLLTVIEGGVDAAVGAASAGLGGGVGGGNQFFNFGSISGRTRGTLGQSALAQDYSRPGTLRRDHGDTITVKTVGDIDLSDVYELREVQEAAAAAGVTIRRRRR